MIRHLAPPFAPLPLTELYALSHCNVDAQPDADAVDDPERLNLPDAHSERYSDADAQPDAEPGAP